MGVLRSVDNSGQPRVCALAEVLRSILHELTASSSLANRACRHHTYSHLDLALPRHRCGTLVLLQIAGAILPRPRSTVGTHDLKSAVFWVS